MSSPHTSPQANQSPSHGHGSHNWDAKPINTYSYTCPSTHSPRAPLQASWSVSHEGQSLDHGKHAR